MNGEKITSNNLFNLYTRGSRDEDVFKIDEGGVGLQIIRKYKTEQKEDVLMFISFYLKDEIVVGGVKRVKSPNVDEHKSYQIIFNDGKDYLNYHFNKSDNVKFDFSKQKILFSKKEFSLNDFIDLLENNHLRSVSFSGNIKEILFKTFDKLFPFFLPKGNIYNIQGVERSRADMPKDPLFEYFYIDKRYLFLLFLIGLYPLFRLSQFLNPNWFTITNPFLLFLVLVIFFLLEILTNFMYKNPDLLFELRWKLLSWLSSNNFKLKII